MKRFEQPRKYAIRSDRIKDLVEDDDKASALEKRLNESELRFRELLEHTRDIAYRVDLVGAAFDYISPVASVILGGVMESYLSMKFCDGIRLIHPSDKDAFIRWCKCVRKAVPGHGEEFRTPREVRVMHVDGSYRWLSVTVDIIFDDTMNKAVAVVGAARDVTTLKKNEDVMRQVRRSLQRSERMKSLSILAAGIAHDLKNILYASSIIPALLLKRFSKVKEFEGRGKILGDCIMMRDSVKQAVDLVQDLMNISGTSKYELIPVDLNMVLSDYVDMAGRHRTEISSSRIELRKELSAGVLQIMGHPMHLRRVFENLFSNACEAMPCGGVLTVSSALVNAEDEFHRHEVIMPSGEYAVFRVCDTGCGIPKENIEKIFDPFFTKTAKKKGGSSGLGLSIVRGVVTDHGGYINVKSEADKGAQFAVYLPIAQVGVRKQAASMVVPLSTDDADMLLEELTGQQCLEERSSGGAPGDAA